MNKFEYIAFLIIFMLFISCKKEVPSTETLSVEGGEEVTFTPKITYPGATYFWEFGDGAVSHDESPTHVYYTPGAHVVSLSIFKNGKIKEKFTQHIVKVTQLYVPRIDYCGVETDDHDYLYADLDSYIRMYVSQEIQDDPDYSYKIFVEGVLAGQERWTNYVFPDSGWYNISFELTDKNGVSGTKDTSVYVGDQSTHLTMNVPDANLGSLGTINEEYVVVYENQSWEYSGDYADFLDYPGPTSGPLINNGELMDYYGPGTGDYFYWDFEPHYYQALSGTTNGSSISIDINAYASYEDFDDLKIYLLLVGTNGINISDIEVQITPGTIVPEFDLPTPTFFSY